jgi:hypothetical protein
MKQVWATPVHVETKIESVTESRFGGVVLNPRLARSGYGAAVGLGLVAFIR